MLRRAADTCSKEAVRRPSRVLTSAAAFWVRPWQVSSPNDEKGHGQPGEWTGWGRVHVLNLLSHT